jgi:hypothetical protein
MPAQTYALATLPTDKTLSLRLAQFDAWKASGGQTTIQLGNVFVPSRRYVKDLIKVGTYVKTADDIAFTITPETLGHWVASFSRMKSNGIKVPLPYTHVDPKKEEEIRKAGDPRDNAGWVDDLWVEDGTLCMACTVIGADAIVAASRSDVSINAPPKYVDGKGNAYVWPITHVALCTDPVVPGLGQFIPIQMSLGQRGAKMLEFLQKLAATLGLDPAQITDEATGAELVNQAIADMLAKMKGGAATDDKGGGTPPPATGATAVNAGGSGSAVRKETVTREFAASQGQPAPIMVKMLTENRELKLSNLVQAGKITPAQRDELAKDYCTPEACKLVLSSGSDGSDFDRLVKVLEANAGSPVKPGEKSGMQTMTLSNGGAGKPAENPILASAERRAKAAADRSKK